MALSCDCYPGCWAEHSDTWTKVDFASEHYAREAYRQCVDHVPYGTYVLVGRQLRFEDQQALDKYLNVSINQLIRG